MGDIFEVAAGCWK